MQKIALLGFVLSTSCLLFAQKINYRPLYNYNTEEAPIEAILDMFNEDYSYTNPVTTTYDSLLLNRFDYRAADIPTFNTEIIMSRMTSMPNVIQMDYNVYVQRYIDMYTIERREHMSKMLGLSKVYFPLFEQELDKANMPIELKYLAVVESALNPLAKSPAGATGPWQFMHGTALEYGLRINSYVDERRDPYKSSLAAIAYLKHAHELFGDWLLAIASYNCGAGNVRKAILRSGGKNNYWDIRPFLPAETRGYVPAFLAAAYSMRYASEHNIYPVSVDFSINQDTIQLTNLDITLNDIAEMTGTDVALLRKLNPELKLDKIPTDETYILRVPTRVSEYFTSYDAYIKSKYTHGVQLYYSQASGETATNVYYGESTPPQTYSPESQSVTSDASSSESAGQTENGNITGEIAVGSSYEAPQESAKTSSEKSTSSEKAKYYTVRSGDSLWEIASRNKLEVSEIKQLNKGISTSLKVGQKVRVK
jgi:membrane-bound lytic murein transglycosylase D